MVPQITVIIPAYNEKAKIHRDLDAWTRFLHDEHSAELIVVDDGSQDGTFAAVEKYVNSYHGNCSVRLCAYSKNRGKGYAVRYGVTQAKGEVVAFADAGLCVPAPQLNGGLEKLKQGYDYAIASRRHQETKVVCSQPLYRQLGSRAFSSVVRHAMGVDFVSDTQCGFKVYTKRAASEIFSRVQTDGFMFDVEALLIARKLGFKGAEFAVSWSNDSDTRYHPVWGTLRNLKELARIRWRVLATKV